MGSLKLCFEAKKKKIGENLYLNLNVSFAGVDQAHYSSFADQRKANLCNMHTVVCADGKSFPLTLYRCFDTKHGGKRHQFIYTPYAYTTGLRRPAATVATITFSCLTVTTANRFSTDAVVYLRLFNELIRRHCRVCLPAYPSLPLDWLLFHLPLHVGIRVCSL